MPNVRCCSCRQWKKKTDSRTINTNSYAWILEKLNIPNDSVDDLFLCSVCERSIRRENELVTHLLVVSDVEDEETNITFDDFFSSPDCGIRCCICKALLTTDAFELSDGGRVDLVIDHGIYVPHDTRICSRHVLRDRIFPDVVIIDHRRLNPGSLERSSAKD